MSDTCQCAIAGWCERRKVIVKPLHWAKCQAGMVANLDDLYSQPQKTDKPILAAKPARPPALDVSTIGTQLRTALESATGQVITCGACLTFLRSLNQQASHRHAAIVDRLLVDLPVPITIREAHKGLEKLRQWIAGVVDRVVPDPDRKPNIVAGSCPVTNEIIWGVAINAAPRPTSSLQATVDSLAGEGWQDLIVFAEPGTVAASGARTIQRPETIAAPVYSPERLGPNGRHGAWQNFVQTLADMLAAFPDANTLLYVQDDVRFSPGAKQLLERDLWPSRRTGIISPYCPDFAGYKSESPILRRITQKNLMGALAYVMPRAAVEELLQLPLCQTWRGAVRVQVNPPWRRKALDAFAGHAMHAIDRKVYFYSHSLVEHFSPLGNHVANSSVGNGSNKGFRVEWQHVKADPVSHFPQKWVRWDNSGGQVFPERPSISTDPVHVIVPGYGLPNVTIRCLEALARSTTSVSLCYVDNGSKEQDFGAVHRAIQTLFPAANVIRNATNRGFTAAVNQGIELANGRHVLILNNDCRVSSQCIQNLRLHIEWHPKVASCAPLTNDSGLCSLKQQENRLAAGINAAMRTPDETQATLIRTRVIPRPVLPWFCALLHHDAVAMVPQLPTDPDVASGLAVDDWWSRRLTAAGWMHLHCVDSYADHDHRSTFKAARINRRHEQRKAAAWLRKHG